MFKSNETIDLSRGKNMQAMTANEAKTQFGEILLKAQRSPVQINKHGKPVAVMLSIQDYENLEELKLKWLQMRALNADEQIRKGELLNGEAFMDVLLSR